MENDKPSNPRADKSGGDLIEEMARLMARDASISRRVGCTIHCGQMLAEARIAKGMPNTTASAVPQTAICTVSSIWAA